MSGYVLKSVHEKLKVDIDKIGIVSKKRKVSFDAILSYQGDK